MLAFFVVRKVKKKSRFGVQIPFPLLTKKYFDNLETLENTGRKERLHGFIF
jgi:hypothetical protein